MSDDEVTEGQLETALEALSHAYEEAAGGIASMSDPQRAFKGATEFADLLRDLAEAAANLRSRTVRRIWEQEQLSLAALAERIGVSKARAGQLINAARTPKEKQ